MRTNKNGWYEVGQVGVDSGQLILGDPCYFKQWEDNDFKHKEGRTPTNEFSYDGACSVTCYSPNMAGELGRGTAVVTSTTYGDGSYKVYIRYEDGVPHEMRVMLNGGSLTQYGEVVEEHDYEEDECLKCGSVEELYSDSLCLTCWESDEDDDDE